METPTIDEYGGNRPGNNLFAESIVAVDLKTGVRKWHFQQVHHGLWDHDNSSASLLIDATINGQPRKLVAQPTKQGWLYVFDRITGQPIWPIPETPVPQTDMPGEKTSPTQPIPSNPPPYSRTFVAEDDLIDFTPALRAQALENLKQVPLGAVAVRSAGSARTIRSPRLDQHRQHRRRRELAGFGLRSGDGDLLHAGQQLRRVDSGSFGGEEFESGPRREVRCANPRQAAVGSGSGLRPVRHEPAGRARRLDARHVQAAQRGAEPRGLTRPARALGEGLDGLPIVKPPYGVIAAIDLNAGGKLKFQVPHGDTPDAIRNHPLLRGMNIPKTGQGGSVGIMVTKTLVVAGDPQLTAPPGRASRRDAARL